MSRLWQRTVGSAVGTDTGAVLAAQAAGVRPLREVIADFSAELRRARRYERPLTLMTVRAEAVPGVEGENGASRWEPPSYASIFFLGSLLREMLRETDLVAYSAEHRLHVVLLPEADDSAARAAICRIGNVVQEFVPVRLRVGVARFPDDGLTAERLLEQALATRYPQLWVESGSGAKEAVRG